MVNKWVNDFMKQKFNEWFTTQLRNELESGKELENTTMKFFFINSETFTCRVVTRLPKPVNFVTRKGIILAGWRASGISAAVEDGLIGFLIDPFKEIDPFD